MSEDNQKPEFLVPDPVIWQELGITPMTGWRYTNDPTLNFPPPIKIRNRNFRSRQLFEKWKAELVQKAVSARKKI